MRLRGRGSDWLSDRLTDRVELLFLAGPLATTPTLQHHTKTHITLSAGITLVHST